MEWGGLQSVIGQESGKGSRTFFLQMHRSGAARARRFHSLGDSESFIDFSVTFVICIRRGL